MGSRITKPESQKTGIETTQPMSSIAMSGCFFPTILTTISASLSAPPVFSRIVPMIAPRMITIPMDEKVPEKPAPIMEGIFPRGIPTMSARMSEIAMRAMNGWTCALLIARIMMTIAITKAMIRPTPDILMSSFLCKKSKPVCSDAQEKNHNDLQVLKRQNILSMLDCSDTPKGESE